MAKKLNGIYQVKRLEALTEVELEESVNTFFVTNADKITEVVKLDFGGWIGKKDAQGNWFEMKTATIFYLADADVLLLNQTEE